MVPRLFSDASIRTLGPQIGMSPLHRVLAFWSMALSHSSLPLASLQRERERRDRGREVEGVGRGGEGGEVTLSVCSFCLSAYFTAEEWQS